MGEVPLGAYERPQFQAFPHRVRAQIVWPSTSRCQSRPNAGKAAHDRVPPAEAGIQGSVVQTARTRLSLLPSVCYSGPLRAGSTEGVAFLGIAADWPKHSVPVCAGGDCPCSRGGPLTRQSRRAERRAPRISALLLYTLRIVPHTYGKSARVTECKYRYDYGNN